MYRTPDKIDLKILQLMQYDASLPQQEIATLVSRTPGAISNRLQRLKQDKYILGYKVMLDGPLLGFSVYGFAEGKIDISSTEFLVTIRQDLSAIKGITECLLFHHYQRLRFKIASRNLAGFTETLAKIKALPYVNIEVSELYNEVLIPERGLQLLP
jgi:Lrp/AsnC family leucine-responsive transcriptional regulator